MYADEQPTRIGLTTKLHMLTKSHHALLHLSQVVCDTTSCAKTCRVPICPVVAPGCKMGKIKYDKCGCQKGCPKQKCKEKCRNISCRQYKCAGPGAGCKVGKLKYDECGCQQGCPKLTCPSQKVGAWFCAGNQAPGSNTRVVFSKEACDDLVCDARPRMRCCVAEKATCPARDSLNRSRCESPVTLYLKWITQFFVPPRAPVCPSQKCNKTAVGPLSAIAELALMSNTHCVPLCVTFEK